ncbi:MAG: DUF1287 domain-containing protein [Rhodobacteraceae bacterium]|nr:DUF1287 domain-containing protein [Paracoccaceae bacterium]
MGWFGKLRAVNGIFTTFTVFFLSTSCALADTHTAEFASRTVAAARSQIGVTVHYDPAYRSLAYPGGDIERSRGVCSDVVIRALRDAHSVDLQALVHRDMKANFSAYPKTWGLSRPDRNIDHRRVLNLRRYFERAGISLPLTSDPAAYLPGDIVSWNLGGGLTHIGVVAEAQSTTGTPLIIHNIGYGTKHDNILFSFEITGHFRPDLKSW